MKNIYPPYCKNISKYIIEEIELKFQELFDKKNDSNYYLIFNEFDSTILTIKTKSHNININESTMLNEDESDFKINLKNKNILYNNLTIIYNILIEETYSSTCSINLIINQYEDLMTSKITIKDVPPIKTDIILESKNILKEETTWKTYLNIEENFQTTYSNIEEIERSYQKIENDTIKTYFIEDNYSLNSQQTEYNLISQKILKTENNLNIDNTHKICFDNCEICEEIPEISEFDNNIHQKCLECIKGYHFEFNTNKCYNDIIMEQGYYFLKMIQCIINVMFSVKNAKKGVQ